MNSTLKLLLLNCVILVVIAFLISTALSNQSKDSPHTIRFSRTLSRETRLNGGPLSIKNVTATSSMKNPVDVVSLANDGVYFDFNAQASMFIDFDSLEKVSNSYYKNATTTFYKEYVVNPCDHTEVEKMVELSAADVNTFKADDSKPFAYDSNGVFIDFYSLKNADPFSFAYIGQSTSKKNDYVSTIDTYWYKDANKVYVIVKMSTACEGVSVFEDSTNQNFKNVDVPTFEYIGTNNNDQLIGYAKDKNFFYSSNGVLSETVTPETCRVDFFKDCLPRIMTSSSSLVQ